MDFFATLQDNLRKVLLKKASDPLLLVKTRRSRVSSLEESDVARSTIAAQNAFKGVDGSSFEWDSHLQGSEALLAVTSRFADSAVPAVVNPLQVGPCKS
jgi:hypothetical protein